MSMLPANIHVRLEDSQRREAEAEERQRKVSEDFRFMVMCAAKDNMGMYGLLRDRSLDEGKKS